MLNLFQIFWNIYRGCRAFWKMAFVRQPSEKSLRTRIFERLQLKKWLAKFKQI